MIHDNNFFETEHTGHHCDGCETSFYERFFEEEEKKAFQKMLLCIIARDCKQLKNMIDKYGLTPEKTSSLLQIANGYKPIIDLLNQQTEFFNLTF